MSTTVKASVALIALAALILTAGPLVRGRQAAAETKAPVREGSGVLPPPPAYTVVSARDASFAGRSRTALRVVVRDQAATMEQVHAALLDAAKNRTSADAVMVFGYWPADDPSSVYTAGRLEWGRDGEGWCRDDRVPEDGKFDPGQIAVKPSVRPAQQKAKAQASGSRLTVSPSRPVLRNDLRGTVLGLGMDPDRFVVASPTACLPDLTESQKRRIIATELYARPFSSLDGDAQALVDAVIGWFSWPRTVRVSDPVPIAAHR